jgi:prepilin-type N-terminal cleavage/methylation domain-containing protein
MLHVADLRFPGRRAFTLVELLVVIAIIGVLVALLFPAVPSGDGGGIEWSAGHRGEATTGGFKIHPPDLQNEGILFVDHQKRGDSGHNGQALVEYRKDHLLAFYLHGSAGAGTGGGHHPLGWTEYRRSTDGGKSWGPPKMLEYSKHLLISEDDGHTWSSPATARFAKKIRAPIMSEKLGDYYFIHGRSGVAGEGSRNLVLYSSRDGIRWDEGRYLRVGPGTYAYSNNVVVGRFDPTSPPRLLIQSSIAYDGAKVNVHHWWVDLVAD